MRPALLLLALGSVGGGCARGRTVLPVSTEPRALPIPRSASEPVTHDHFRSLRTRVDRRGNFEAAFGQSLAEFEPEAVAHLATAVR